MSKRKHTSTRSPSGSQDVSSTPRVPDIQSRSGKKDNAATDLSLVPGAADGGWWNRPLTQAEARLLREATGLVLRDAVRYHESGHASRSQAAEATEPLRADVSDLRGRLATAVADWAARSEVQQAELLSARRDAAGLAETVTEDCAAVRADVRTLANETKRENAALRGQVGALTADLKQLERDLETMRDKLGALEAARRREATVVVGSGAPAAEAREKNNGPPPSAPRRQGQLFVLRPQGVSAAKPETKPDVDVKPVLVIDLDEVSAKQPTPKPTHIKRRKATPAPSALSSVSLSTLLDDAEHMYQQNPGKTDIISIWAFIEGLSDATLREHIQRYLLECFDGTLVRTVRPRRRKADEKNRGRDGRIVHISPELTWRQFAEAVRTMDVGVGSRSIECKASR
ncbi:hypothetical protein VTK73DRAFT_3849 [Phialemonium thermophilum]|uniref:Uncharacterized protein n=1 Tax=Phialemonium thermophilum TaxID=223376 RepID=A0ABR3WX19_9PEZI